MPTMNFSVPEDVKTAFNDAFSGENKSAIIAALMRQAVAERTLERQRQRAIDALLALRDQQAPIDEGDFDEAREALRK